MSIYDHIERVVADERMRANELAHGRLAGQGLLDYYDAANEDAYGRLPHERGYGTSTPTEEIAVTIAATHPDADHVDPEAPWGRKNDGSPKAKPGRKPKASRIIVTTPTIDHAPLRPRTSAGGGAIGVLAHIAIAERLVTV